MGYARGQCPLAIRVEHGSIVYAYGVDSEPHYRPGKQFVVTFSVGALKLLLGWRVPAGIFRRRQRLLLRLCLVPLRSEFQLRGRFLARRLRHFGSRVRAFGFGCSGHRLLSILLALPHRLTRGG